MPGVSVLTVGVVVVVLVHVMPPPLMLPGLATSGHTRLHTHTATEPA